MNIYIYYTWKWNRGNITHSDDKNRLVLPYGYTFLSLKVLK